MRTTALHPEPIEAIAEIASSWNQLALTAGSPFLTYEWLSSWWKAFGAGRLLVTTSRAADGRLVGAACCRLSPNGVLSAPTDTAYSSEWNALAEDEEAREAVWEAIARFGAPRVHFFPLREGRSGAEPAREALEANGYHVLGSTAQVSPFLRLPRWDDLVESLSANTRQQWRRKRRGLERRGRLELREPSDEGEFDRELDVFLRLEASGWKGRAGTAILSNAASEHLFARSRTVRAGEVGFGSSSWRPARSPCLPTSIASSREPAST
jgi:CelD/BcsL family acetyltransferase involved in cellulose biosynthesis